MRQNFPPHTQDGNLLRPAGRTNLVVVEDQSSLHLARLDDAMDILIEIAVVDSHMGAVDGADLQVDNMDWTLLQES
jgi:hypothetical protein